jgi:hypothetical protein
MTDKPKFHVIEGSPAPDTPKERAMKRVREMPRPAEMICCHRCGGAEVIQTKIGMVHKNGKATGGTRQFLCALCFMRGERIVLSR